MNAVIYARYSSDKQTEQSIEGQLREGYAYAERAGMTIVGAYIDRAISGTSDQRPDFQRMIADSAKRQFEAVIVWKLDRFARNRYDSAIYKSKLKKNGVRVFSVTEGIGDGDESIILEAVLEAMAEMYSKQLGQNAARGMRETARKGLCTGGQIPLGYVVGEDHKLHIDSKTAPAVQLIYTLFADGKTKTQIAKELNARGFRTKNGKLYTSNSFFRILTNPMYYGDYTYKGDIPRECPAIISRALYDKCQERNEATKRSRGMKTSEVEWRPDFQRMIADSAKRQFEAVIVWKLDRFARNRYDSAIYKSKLKKNGVRVFSVTEGIGDGDESIILEAVLEAMAEMYSKQLGQNAARGMRETARKGLCTGGQIPLGYVVGEDHKLHIDSKTAPAVQLIYTLFADGKTKTQIAKELNARGFRTKNGKLYTSNSFFRILTNPMYYGDYTYKGDIPRECPAIISRALYDKCQERNEATKRSRGMKTSEVEWLLRGKLFCGHCGTQMTGDSGTGRANEKHYYYTCHKRKRYKDCDKKSEKKEQLERAVCQKTVEYVLREDRIGYIAERVVEQYEKEFDASIIKEKEMSLIKLDAELDKCAESLMHTTVRSVVDRINARAEELEAAKFELEHELAQLRITSKARITVDEIITFLRGFCSGDVEDIQFRRKIVDTFINAVYVFDDKYVVYYNVRDCKQVTYSDMLASIHAPSDMSAHGSDCLLYGEPLLNVP